MHKRRYTGPNVASEPGESGLVVGELAFVAAPADFTLAGVFLAGVECFLPVFFLSVPFLPVFFLPVLFLPVFFLSGLFFFSGLFLFGLFLSGLLSPVSVFVGTAPKGCCTRARIKPF